ncbi:MAG: PIG-L family deacetylase [Candidatus Saccharibacteria bacterium]
MDKKVKSKNDLIDTVSAEKDKVFTSFTKTVFALLSLFVLFATTVLWTIMGAKLQGSNSDQLIGPYLLQNNLTFKQATFPGVHSSLIKWPFFEIVKLYHYSPNSYVYVTLGLVLATIAALVFIIWRIERRPLVFGTICLALASVLLLVPTEPTTGALLPVSMAMITTRNIEYIFFILSLILLIRHKGLKNWQYWVSVILLAILISSDKLFVSISLGGALIGIIIYSFARKWKTVSYFAHWFGSAIAAWLVGSIILWAINRYGITGIINGTSTSYYGASGGVKGIVTGTIYATMGLFTNLGANPAYGQVIVKSLPSSLISGLFSFSFISYVVNLGIFLAGIFSIFKLFSISLVSKKGNQDKDVSIDNYFILCLMLIFSTITIIGLFIFTNHYYAVDARYLTIIMFTAFICLACYLRRKKLRSNLVLLAALAIFISIGFGIFSVFSNYNRDSSSLSEMSSRNQQVADILKNHNNPVLIGNYWRVVPIKAQSKNNQDIMPVSDCRLTKAAFDSGAWQKDLRHTGFAYLLTIKGETGGFQSCNSDKILSYFGKPNSTSLVSGTYSKPKELLLFYSNGINIPLPKVSKVSPSPLLPVDIANIQNTECNGPTIMNIVAHEDDDLLFMNPTTYNNVNSNRCIRSVYVTAGDAGSRKDYWVGRQNGIEAAYSYMLGTPKAEWTKQTVKLANDEYVEIASPNNSTKISLVFMLLPDGNQHGEGFESTKFETIGNLYSGSLETISGAGGQSNYTKDSLISGLEALMLAYRPSVINTQSTFNQGPFFDHSDHISVANFVNSAYKSYESEQYQNLVTIPLNHYRGYTVHELPQNLSKEDINTKTLIFLQYGLHDPAVCTSKPKCFDGSVYGNYLTRQYLWPN